MDSDADDVHSNFIASFVFWLRTQNTDAINETPKYNCYRPSKYISELLFYILKNVINFIYIFKYISKYS